MKSKAMLASGFFGLAILTITTAIEIDGEEVAPATPADDWEQVTVDNSTSEVLYSALKNVSSYYPTVSATLMCSNYIAQIEKQANLFRFNVLGCTWDTADNVGQCLPEWSCEKEALKVYIQETPVTNDVMLIEDWKPQEEGWPVEDEYGNIVEE